MPESKDEIIARLTRERDDARRVSSEFVAYERMRIAEARLAAVPALAEALAWALDVLELCLQRLDSVDTYTAEHHAIRTAGLAKARGVLAAFAAYEQAQEPVNKYGLASVYRDPEDVVREQAQAQEQRTQNPAGAPRVTEEDGYNREDAIQSVREQAQERNPNPGSDEARKAGCICAVIDNNHGLSAPWPPDGWWVTEGCPVHTLQAQEQG